VGLRLKILLIISQVAILMVLTAILISLTQVLMMDPAVQISLPMSQRHLLALLFFTLTTTVERTMFLQGPHA
jgi:hypothetical protein